VMQEEMMVLEQNETWELIIFPSRKKVIGCKWVCTVKLNTDGSLARLKAILVTKSYSQVMDRIMWILSLRSQSCRADHGIISSNLPLAISWTLRMLFSMILLMRKIT